MAATALGRAAEREEPASESVPPAPILIADLRKSATDVFSYTSWKDRVNPTPGGLEVVGSKGAQGDGGIGRNLTSALDLSGASYVDVALGLGATNEVPFVTVAFNDADGTQVAARIHIDQIVPKQAVWFRVRRSDFVPVAIFPGHTPGMDWTKVVQWHLQGDWTTKKPFHGVFIALRAQP